LDISTTYVGLKLRNPIIIAAAGITETAERIEKAAQAGAGAVVMKSFFDDEIKKKYATGLHVHTYHNVKHLMK